MVICEMVIRESELPPTLLCGSELDNVRINTAVS